MNKSRVRWLCALTLGAAAWLGAASSSWASVTLVTDEGGNRLRGANGITVGGLTYDVVFKTGTCVDVFNGCDQTSDFAFSGKNEADAALQAMLDQVFHSNIFDDQPGRTFGCAGLKTVDAGNCDMVAPWATNGTLVTASWAVNTGNEPQDKIGDGPGFGVNVDLGASRPSCGGLEADFCQSTWAVFNQVPEPSALSLAGISLVLLGAFRRRRKAGA